MEYEVIGLSLNITGAIIGCTASTLYAFRIWHGKEHANLATWLIGWVLDVVGLYLAYATGNTRPYIQIGWLFVASIILFAILKQRGNLVWGKTDSWVVVLCGISVGIWLVSGHVIISIAGYIFAAALSAWPQAKDYFNKPDSARASAWIWIVGIISMLFTLASKLVIKELGPEHILFYFAYTFINIVMSWLCMRGKKI